jgi:hypothetical protein
MRKALIVGIDDYKNAPLKGCVNDAAALSSILENNGDGIPNFDVKLVTNVSTKSELKKYITELFSGESDISLLYFSGHGIINEFGGYIVTPDAQQYDEGVSMQDILVLANKSKSTNKVIILDSCYSGSFGSPEISGGEISQLKEGITVLTASKKDEVSVEVNGHGIFTNLLIDALQGGAADLRGHITPGSVYAYIDQALGSWDQRPVFKTNISRFVSLRNISPQVPLSSLRKITEYFSSPEEEYSLDPTYEFDDSIKTNSEDKAIPAHVSIFKELQKFESVGLVVPIGEEHMFYAAINSKGCKLTALGAHYWRLAKDKRI